MFVKLIHRTSQPEGTLEIICASISFLDGKLMPKCINDLPKGPGMFAGSEAKP